MLLFALSLWVVYITDRPSRPSTRSRHMRLRPPLPALAPPLPPPALPPAEEAQNLSAEQPAARIAALVAAKWADRKVTAAPKADDAEWVRRLTLDLNGRIPDILAAR